MKRYRVYYNRTADFPRVWSIDEGSQDTEVHVVAVHLYNTVAETKVDFRIPASSSEVPRVWIEAEGFLTVSSGVAIIRGSRPVPKQLALTFVNGEGAPSNG